jgi:hypothetical protein
VGIDLWGGSNKGDTNRWSIGRFWS